MKKEPIIQINTIDIDDFFPPKRSEFPCECVDGKWIIKSDSNQISTLYSTLENRGKHSKP